MSSAFPSLHPTQELEPPGFPARFTLIEKVIVTPDPDAPDGMAAELYGDLAEILVLASEPAALKRRVRGEQTKNPQRTDVRGGVLSVVAGTRSQLNLLLSG
jgi:hypothetical protein